MQFHICHASRKFLFWGVEAPALFAFCLFPLQVLPSYKTCLDLEAWGFSCLCALVTVFLEGFFFYLPYPPAWFWQQGARYCIPYLGAEEEGFINLKCAHGAWTGSAEYFNSSWIFTSQSVGEAFIAHCWAIFPTSLNSNLWSALEQFSRSFVTGESSKSCHHLQWSTSMV